MSGFRPLANKTKSMRTATSFIFGAIPAVLRRPDLWRTALRQARLLTPPGWWRRPPFLPVPPGSYLRFRLQTAYGGDGRGPVRPDDVVTYLEWCRTFHRL